MAGKAEAIFESVYTAVNRRRAGKSGALDQAALKEILEEQGVDKKAWYAALARAKRQTPNLYGMLYEAFGKEPPAPRQGAEAASADDQVDQVEEAPPAPADVLANVVAWLDKVTPGERRRIMSAASAFFSDSELECAAS